MTEKQKLGSMMSRSLVSLTSRGLRRSLGRAAFVFVATMVAGVSSPSALAHPEIELQLANVSAQIEQSPGEAKLYLQRGQIHRVHRDWQAGMADFRRAEELDPELHRVALAIGRLMIEAGKPKQALPPLERFLQGQPGDPEGLILRGRGQGELGETLAAAADFDAALPKLRRPTPELYIERARILFDGGEPFQARALAGLEQGIERLGDLFTLHRYAAELEIRSDQPEAALRRAQALIEKSGGNVSWRILEAELLVALQRAPEARISYRQALDTIAALPLHRRRTPAVTEKKQLIGKALAELDLEN